MLTSRLHAIGLRSWQLQLSTLMSIAFCVGLWIRAKTLDQEERGNAERRALFAGLWPPTLWGIASSLERHEQPAGQRRLPVPTRWLPVPTRWLPVPTRWFRS